jgi:sensor histidine kinase regulating citrate/malate metabolism
MSQHHEQCAGSLNRRTFPDHRRLSGLLDVGVHLLHKRLEVGRIKLLLARGVVAVEVDLVVAVRKVRARNELARLLDQLCHV